MKQNPDALYTHIQHGSILKKKRIPKNANYKVICSTACTLYK
jgi:hypothetical protein